MVPGKSCSETYVDLRSWIFKLCYEYIKIHGGNFEDCLSTANIAFMEAWDRHDPNRAPFRLYLRKVVQSRLLDMGRTTNVDKRLKKRCKSRVKKVENERQRKNDFQIFLIDLPKDAMEIVQLVMHNPLASASNSSSFRKILKTYLREIGWSNLRINISFDCIKESLV